MYTCGPDGTWIDGDLHCEGLMCGAVAPTEHAKPCAAGRYSSGDGLIPTAQCAPRCADGYDLNKTAQMPTNYTCALRAGKGSWTGGALACSPRVCESAAPVVNAKECEAGPTCAATCADGYEASGKDKTVQYHCGDDRKWNSNEVFACASDKSSKWWTIPVVVVGGALLMYFCGECVVGKLLTRIRHKRYGTTVKLSSHQDGLLDNDGLAAAGSSISSHGTPVDASRGTSVEWDKANDSGGSWTTRPDNAESKKGWFSSPKIGRGQPEPEPEPEPEPQRDTMLFFD